MIPPFGDQGYLPPGVHPATLDEVEARFGRESELRRVQMGFPRDLQAEAELLAGLPFLELSLVNQADFDLLVGEFFATDRHSVGKGMVEVIE